MDLGTDATISLALGMATIAVVNAGLMAWLWRFPMAPDPTGRDPNGVSTAPRAWTAAHRVLGYAFLSIYAFLLLEMVPRLWEFREAAAAAVAHGALGALVGLLLLAKIAVVRRFRRFGQRLPWIGGTLAATTIVAVALVVPPALRVLRPGSSLPPELAGGREAVAARCLQCHGASTIDEEREDRRRWDRITREMQDRAARASGKKPISEEERSTVAAYLSTFLSENEGRGDDTPGGRDREGRRGGRGRER